MKIEAINTNQNNYLFGSSNERHKNVDRAVTVRDLYEMEDRIIANQEKLIKNQNEMIGKTLQSMVRLVYNGFNDEYFDQAMDDASLLKLNVNA